MCNVNVRMSTQRDTDTVFLIFLMPQDHEGSTGAEQDLAYIVCIQTMKCLTKRSDSEKLITKVLHV